MFKSGSCPTGWVRDGWWDNRFPMGASGSIGGTGGASSVKLSVNNLPKHRHDIRGQPARLVRSAVDNKRATIGVLSADMGSQLKIFQTQYEGGGKSFDITNPYRRTLFCRKS